MIKIERALYTLLMIAAVAGLVAIFLVPDPESVVEPGKAPAVVQGDDNGDAVIDEDESGWNCHTMGNKTCGPNAPADGYVNR